MPNYHVKLRDLLTRIEDELCHYDYVILDCPPNLGMLTWNALHAADEVVVPVEPSFFSLHGLGKISETLQVVNRSRETPLAVHALLTLFNSHVNFSHEIYDEVKAHFQNRLFTTIIHEHVSLKESAAAGQSIAQYAPQSAAFQDYLNLAVEYLERDWNRKLPEKELGWEQVFKNHFGPRQISDGSSKHSATSSLWTASGRWIPISRRKKKMPTAASTLTWSLLDDGRS
ncbi:MAG: ParA family protein [Candidatus Omnitrophica bacterium]|nr:ParA family protein [Candidatus Omnitrophota bacterium]